MPAVEETINAWQSALCEAVDIASLYARNRVAHKWKATYRSMCLRETVAWRFIDLASQSLYLHKNSHALGARIILRSALETLSMLIYLNQITRKVLDGSLDFLSFSDKTIILLGGSRDNSSQHVALNIITILQKYAVRYPDIGRLYDVLSESAHPNYEGMRLGYSETDHKNFITTFSNRWSSMYSGTHISLLEAIMGVFESEYNIEWREAFEALELWLERNDANLVINRE